MLDKQTVTINFAQGIDQFTDVNQMPMGKFLDLQNSVFIKTATGGVGALQKRNGFPVLASTVGSASYITSYSDNLVAVGDSVQAYSTSLGSFVPKGNYFPVRLSTLPIVYPAFGALQVDAALSTNGLLCATYTCLENSPLVAPALFKYVILDSLTGQIVSGPTNVTSSGGAQLFSSKVFFLNDSFVIFNDALNNGAGASSSSFYQYRTVNQNTPGTESQIVTVSSNAYFFNVNAAGGVTFPQGTGASGSVYNNNLYYAFQEGQAAGRGNLRLLTISSSYAVTQQFVIGTNSYSGFSNLTTQVSTMGSGTLWLVGVGFPGDQVQTFKFSRINLDFTNYASNLGGFSLGSGMGYTANITSTLLGNRLDLFVESQSTYGYDASTHTNAINKRSIYIDRGSSNNTLGSVSEVALVSRSLGLGSQAFITNSASYFLGTYDSLYQSTYYLTNSTGLICGKLAYGNGGGYITAGLPNANVIGTNSVFISYLNQNVIEPVNKATNVSSNTQTVGIYAKAGAKTVRFDFDRSKTQSTSLAGDLHINGGILWSYDGYQPTEHGFFLYPDNVKGSTSGSGGQMTAQTYNYQAIYSWTDNTGNIFRSAPSVPLSVVAGSGSSQATINVPTLRLSYKNFPYNSAGVTSPVSIELYRWSTGQQVYYKCATFIQSASAASSDYNAFVDILPDSSIIGNQILYTNGGVLENISAPATKDMTIFDDRLWLIDAEDQNLLWFSQQVLESTPVELSDLLTFFVNPTAGTQGTTGPMQCIFPMDDKLIIFKKNAIYYINGVGPDATGANNQYSQPIFITASVGCSNKASVVLIPQGIMFQSDNGIWLLGRDLSTKYIGNEVEDYNNDPVKSVVNVAGTSEVRFSMQSGKTLIYDYLMDQWGTFVNLPALSSVIYNNKHTLITSSSSVWQETSGSYVDGPGQTPVNMYWQTGWINIGGGLQGYRRVYRAYMLGNYISSNSFNVGVAYNYDSTVTQNINISPLTTSVEQWQINFQQQQCQSFQLSFQESNAVAGAGLTVSGVSLLAGVKKSWPQNIAPAQRKG